MSFASSRPFRPFYYVSTGSLRARHLNALRQLAALFLLLMAGRACWGNADWPTHRGDDARRAFAETALPEFLSQHWVYQASQPPQPAWPAPARGSYWQELTSIAPRVIDDHCFHVVVSQGLVLFGSSADDTVRALDVNRGQLQWQYTTDGPVRYAPTVANDRAFVGSDDGYVYCLELSGGQLVWRTALAPEPRHIPGNGRIISIWPVRTNVVVDDVAVRAFAGIFPHQSVHGVALSLESGEVLNRNEVNLSPQGYLLQDATRLIVPRGRANPCVVDKRTMQIVSELPGEGGTFALIDRQHVVSGTGNDATLVTSDPADPQKEVARFSGRQLAVSSEFWYLLGPAAVAAIDRTTIGGSDEPVSQSPRPSIRWRVELEGGESIAACQNRVVVGGDREVLIVAADSGQVKQRMPVDGKALGVAISDRKCYVSTTTGRIYCFGEDGREDVQADEQTDEQTDGPPVTDGRVTADGAVPTDGAAIGSAGEAVNGESQSHDHAPPLNDLLPEFASVAETMQLGYGVILGTDSDALVEGLLRDTKLHLLVLEQDLTRIDAFRRRWIGRGLYGTRLAALHVEPSRLSLATGFANLVAVGGGDLTWDLAEAKRLLSPARGYGWFGDQPIVSSPDADPSRGKWTHLYGSPANTAFTDDSQITDRLQLQWFGGPGPRRMVDRHLRAAAPLAQDGLMIVPGENRLIGVDSFNGTELWELDVPDSQRYTIPYDSGYYGLEKGRLAIAVKHDAWIVDTATGTVNERVALSDLPEVAPLPPAARWGYLALQSGRLYGSAMKPDAARLEPSRRLIEIDYGNQQPLVTSNVFFCLAPSPDPAESAENATGWNVLWSHEACILHPTICVTDQFVWFVQSRHPSMVTHPSGRIPLADLLAADAKLVCLDARTGRLCWERALPAELNECTNILYVQANDAALVVSGSLTQDNDTLYRLAVLDPTSGELRWQTEHFEGKPDAFAHGEQVHHPVVMHDRVIAEPYIYRLSDGQRVLPFGVPGDWRMVRPGHSCGTLTASRECVFFRATNPTMMSLSSGTPEFQRMQKLAPSRPGCWINIIPADGLVLIPEASASCVCAFSLQTSMAFAPASSK